MEGVVDLTELLMQIHPVSYLANPGNHSKWPNILGPKLSLLLEAHYTLLG